jgi:hypothetical protein
VVGPFAIAALTDATGGFATSFYLIAIGVLLSALLPATLRKPSVRAAPAVEASV